MVRKIRTKIEWLFTESGLSNYAIAKKTQLSTQFLDRYKNNLNLIDNMKLKHAKILEKLADELQGDTFMKPIIKKETELRFTSFKAGKQEYRNFDEWKKSGNYNEHKDYVVTFRDVEKNYKWALPTYDERLNLNTMTCKIDTASLYNKEDAINAIKTVKACHEAGVEFGLYFMKDGKYIGNESTDNLNSINSFSWGYSVYGDLVPGGQLDSRYESDETLADAVYYYLEKGCIMVAPIHNYYPEITTLK